MFFDALSRIGVPACVSGRHKVALFSATGTPRPGNTYAYRSLPNFTCQVYHVCALGGEKRLNLLRAIIFDFDGVIVDSEPLIMKLTQQMAALEGWRLTPEEYYRDYLALDDRGIVEHLYRSHGLPVDPARRAELVQWKAEAYQEAILNGLPAMPGAVDFVMRCSSRYPLAIASGSLRVEVETLLRKLKLREKFQVLATAEDCERSKPDPTIYFIALRRLQALEVFLAQPLQTSECLAIEDAPAGVIAAHAAGMKCLAVTHSTSARELSHADWVFQSFAEVNVESLQKACGQNAK